jgi:integrase
MHPIEGRGWSRKNINRAVNRIRGMFKWAAASELAPASVHHGLMAVAGLKVGRCEARETEPIQPVADSIVDAVLPFLTSTVKAMIQLQRLTGARPGEICTMRIGDLQRTGEVWTYRLQQHKTQHHGRQRAISIGPRAQHVLKPFLLRIDPSAYIFSPADAVAEMRQRRSENRKTPIGHGNRRGTNVKRRPKRTPSTSYDVAAYRRAITRACDVADVWAKGGQIVANDERIISRWHPHQLRHTAATDIRRQFGLEAAQHVLGHASVDMTQVYAERNQEIARAVAAKIG